LIDIDLTGVELLGDAPTAERLEHLLRLAFSSAGVNDGHVALDVVEEAAIAVLNLEHRNLDKPTDVLSFPMDGAGESIGPRELGDIVICPPLCESVERAAVHGALHLVGMDHATDNGEMLALEAEILRWEQK